MSRIIIGIAGENGSGKGTVTKYLMEKYGASYHKFSTVLRNILDLLNLEQSRSNLDTLSIILRKAYGDDVLAKAMSKSIVKDDNAIVIIDGVRREADLMCIHNIPGFVLCFVQTSLETRYKRIVQRGENTDDTKKTYEEFLKESQSEPQSQIQGLKGSAKHIIDNDGTLEELHAKIDAIMKEETNHEA